MRILDSGRDVSIDDVYKSVSEGLFYYISGLSPSKFDAQEIFSHCIYQLLTGPQEYSSYEHIRRRLYVIARNKFIDYSRQKNRLNVFKDDIHYLSNGCEIQRSKENAYALLLESTFKSLKNLPHQRQTVLELYFLQGKTTGQIAELLKLKNQTVLNHKAKGIEHLRKMLFLKEETADLMEDALPF